MSKALLILGLTLTLCPLVSAAPLYQWTDKDGSTRMTAEAPPMHATQVKKLFTSEPPPMAASVIPAEKTSAALIQPADKLNAAEASRRLQDAVERRNRSEAQARQTRQDSAASEAYPYSVDQLEAMSGQHGFIFAFAADSTSAAARAADAANAAAEAASDAASAATDAANAAAANTDRR
jgi:hypothetical protein